MKITRYAQGTSVSVEKSRADLDRLLASKGATQRMLGTDEVAGHAWCLFTMTGRQVRLRVPIPAPGDYAPKRGEEPRSWHAWGATHRAEWCQKQAEQIERERWRCLLLLVKAKLELVALGISTVEREFLADLYLPNGQTVHEALAPKIAEAYETGRMPPLLGSAMETT